MSISTVPVPPGGPAAFALVSTRARDSLDWMRTDLLVRILPFFGLSLFVWGVWHPAWLGFSPGDVGVQLTFGLLAGPLMFLAATLIQLPLSRWRGALRVPATAGDAGFQAGYFGLNAIAEEAFFRGLLQGGLFALGLPVIGLVLPTAAYAAYHRLGDWAWRDVALTAGLGLPLALAFWLLPGPHSLVGVVIAHFLATCGFLGPGPYLLRRLHVVG